MADSMSSPWLSDYLVQVAETHGALLLGVPVCEKKKKVQLIEFLTFDQSSQDDCLWANISDKAYYITARFNKDAMVQYNRYNEGGRRLTERRNAIVTVKKFRPFFTRVPVGNNVRKMTEHPRLALDIGDVDVLGSDQEPVFGYPVDIEKHSDIKAWSEGLRTDGGGGNVLKIRKQAAQARDIDKPSPTKVPQQRQLEVVTITSSRQVARECATTTAAPRDTSPVRKSKPVDLMKEYSRKWRKSAALDPTPDASENAKNILSREDGAKRSKAINSKISASKPNVDRQGRGPLSVDSSPSSTPRRSKTPVRGVEDQVTPLPQTTPQSSEWPDSQPRRESANQTARQPEALAENDGDDDGGELRAANEPQNGCQSPVPETNKLDVAEIENAEEAEGLAERENDGFAEIKFGDNGEEEVTTAPSSPKHSPSGLPHPTPAQRPRHETRSSAGRSSRSASHRSPSTEYLPAFSLEEHSSPLQFYSTFTPVFSGPVDSPRSARRHVTRKVPYPIQVSPPNLLGSGPAKILVPNSDTSGTQTASQIQSQSQSQSQSRSHSQSQPYSQSQSQASQPGAKSPSRSQSQSYSQTSNKSNPSVSEPRIGATSYFGWHNGSMLPPSSLAFSPASRRIDNLLEGHPLDSQLELLSPSHQNTSLVVHPSTSILADVNQGGNIVPMDLLTPVVPGNFILPETLKGENVSRRPEPASSKHTVKHIGTSLSFVPDSQPVLDRSQARDSQNERKAETPAEQLDDDDAQTNQILALAMEPDAGQVSSWTSSPGAVNQQRDDFSLQAGPSRPLLRSANQVDLDPRFPKEVVESSVDAELNSAAHDPETWQQPSFLRSRKGKEKALPINNTDNAAPTSRSRPPSLFINLAEKSRASRSRHNGERLLLGRSSSRSSNRLGDNHGLRESRSATANVDSRATSVDGTTKEVQTSSDDSGGPSKKRKLSTSAPASDTSSSRPRSSVVVEEIVRPADEAQASPDKKKLSGYEVKVEGLPRRDEEGQRWLTWNDVYDILYRTGRLRHKQSLKRKDV